MLVLLKMINYVYYLFDLWLSLGILEKRDVYVYKKTKQRYNESTVFGVITAHAPISAQSNNIWIFMSQLTCFYPVIHKSMLWALIWIASTYYS